MKKGNVVRVKPGVKDVDFDVDLDGWQGRVIEIGPDDNVMVAWDSHTLLRDMPATMITACEEQGFGWETYGCDRNDLELAQARDTLADVEAAIEELESSHAWEWLGEEGELIRHVLKDVDPDDEVEVIEVWDEYMQAHLVFPFDAVVDEFQEHGPLQAGSRVRVHCIMDADEFYGIIVRLRRGRQQFDFPLCDLAALDETSGNYVIIQNYRVWFANR
ncbi:MAG: hypothetical protein JXR84_23645 [Anaerolineae bacterium]|nr:hypothetical protein [Anaerolineae bacterium]